MRFVIHAGFPKCGSSSIQQALRNQEAVLKRRSIFVFGKGLLIDDAPTPSSRPFWLVMQALQAGWHNERLGDHILGELERVGEGTPDATVILSAETLSRPGPQRLFRKIQERIDTTAVFYLRPQFAWIPSAWKQWGITDGSSLQGYVAKCLRSGRPGLLRTLDAWSADLPKSRMIVRILPEVVANAGGPVKDFFGILGVEADDRESTDDLHVNPSPDFAILRVLNKNPWLFKDGDSSRVYKQLARVLPDHYLKTNIKMLPLDQEKRIAAHFRAENMKVLRKFVGLTKEAADFAYARYFEPRESGRTYSDVGTPEIFWRGSRILLETIFRNPKNRVGWRVLLRSDGWKTAWRAARGLGGRS